MKIIIAEFPATEVSPAYCNVTVRDSNGINQALFVYDTIEQCEAFVKGFNTCQSVINGLVQQLPQRAERIKGNPKWTPKEKSIAYSYSL
jgi:hypothetical protein